MPLASIKERKQNEKNSLLDFRILGKQITLQSRPSPSSSRSSSRIEVFRPMSATPTLFHQQEKHRKTPPWTRPQSADHLSRGPRRKLAAKFERNERKLKKSPRKNGSMGNLLESSSFEDNLDSETSITPSPVPSLTDVLRSGKLEPGLAAKPPIPPVGSLQKKNKSVEDIINIKFQRWFPESVIQKTPYLDEEKDEIYPTEEMLQKARDSDNENFNFEAYENHSETKKLPRSKTMETIVEDPQPETSRKEKKDILTSKIGQTLNKYYKNEKSDDYAQEIVSIIENSETPSKVLSHLMTENKEIGPEHAVGLQKVFEDENASCMLKYIDEKNTKPTNKVLNTEGILTWMGNGDNNGIGSTYDDILNMLKVLEKEEVESFKTEVPSRSGHNSACNMAVGAKDILSFLDDIDRTDSRNEIVPEVKICEKTMPGRMAQLMSLDSAELAKRVMALSLELEERESVLSSTNEKLKEVEEKHVKIKQDSDTVVKRHQKFIDQLLTEKRLLADQCASLVKEMENKHSKALQAIDERHNIELKKLQEKMLSAEKIRREKWLEEKTKKIKEQTAKGLEPELERITRAHQDELTEIRRAHEKELSEMEASCSRRINSAREQSLRDREQAVTEEREAARKKLEHELSEVERSYQDQRRRLMSEVRDEKERVGREGEANLMTKSKLLEEKWHQARQELDEKISLLQEKHEGEIKSMKDMMEAERQSWLNHQSSTLDEKEKMIREQCKKERDRHIDAVIRRLDKEAQEKEKIIETKLIKVKEQYEADLKDADIIQSELRKKLKESRNENQQNEESFAKLKSQIHHLEFQLMTTKQQLERSEREGSEKGDLARNEVSTQITSLQKELAEVRLKREELIASLQAEKEKELQQVYNRVKEAISKKEETMRLIQRQRDAALEQCNQLESILEQQRRDYIQRKNH